ncbi:MAG: DUF2703 domain-containing protein [Chloroflexi bacterium]|nr:DUF2703 domain-containing protein [Chloroflexota bacterium]
MKIELQWFEGCPNHHAAREILDDVLAAKNVDAKVELIEVPDLETGERVKFPGSPTIRINGVDVDPDYEDTGDYTPRCRVYMTPDGYKGVPEREWIEVAVETALDIKRERVPAVSVSGLHMSQGGDAGEF